MSQRADHARAAVAKHDLRPIENPAGNDHHTDTAFTREDEEVAELAFWLGGLFVDVQGNDPHAPLKESFWYKDMTSLDTWKRVARALRVHGLKIANREDRQT